VVYALTVCNPEVMIIVAKLQRRMVVSRTLESGPLSTLVLFPSSQALYPSICQVQHELYQIMCSDSNNHTRYTVGWIEWLQLTCKRFAPRVSSMVYLFTRTFQNTETLRRL
jgi:hypothetical protein